MKAAVEIGLGVLAAALLLGAAHRWRAEMPVPQAPADPMSLDVVEPRLDEERDSLDVAAEVVAARDPFRLPQEAALAERAATAAEAAAVPRAAAPLLVVRAIVGGPPWQAVLDGLPGQPPGTVVTSGAEIGGLRVVAVTRDSVVVRGLDTTWTLALRSGAR
jgi:hypothetical protein